MPYFSSTIFVVSLVGAVLTALTGYFLFIRALFPEFVERAETEWTDRPIGAFGLGIPVAAVLGFISVATINAPNPIARLVGFVLTGVALGFTFAGTAGLVARLSRRFESPNDGGHRWRPILRAGVVLELTMLFPALGWFVIAPIAVIGGAGAATFALFRRRAPRERLAPTATTAPLLVTEKGQ